MIIIPIAAVQSTAEQFMAQAVIEIPGEYLGDRAEFGTDPQWFTDYSRRPTVEWQSGRAATTEAAE